MSKHSENLRGKHSASRPSLKAQIKSLSPEKLTKKSASVLLTCGLALGMLPVVTSSFAAERTAVSAQNPYLIGAGTGDITGEPGEVGFLGYADTKQVGSGLMTRQYARAFEIQDPTTGERNLMVITDELTAHENVRNEVIKRVQKKYGSQYGESNIMLSANHTHSTPGGIGRYSLYNVTTLGWHEDTYNAIVNGIMDAIDEAHADLAPGNMTVSQSKLTGVGVNRSAVALAKDKKELTDSLVDGVDPTNVTMRFERNGKTRALINWFAIHPTSMTSANTLISSDNKGYAEWLIEHNDHGVDYYSGSGDGFVAAFANSNTGDVSPNTWLKPGQGPTNDPFTNMKIQGTKQANEVRRQLTTKGTPVGTGLDSAIHYADYSNMTISGQFTSTGKTEKTCQASLGQPFGSGSEEDGGGGLPIFGEGIGTNKFFSSMSKLTYAFSADQAACQAPKEQLLAVGIADAVPEQVPVQIMQFGNYYILGMPGELNGAVGVQYRKDAAALFGVDESHIIIQGYTNAYNHYVTTPEEYDSQQYEGGATVFGRETMGAFRQEINVVGTALRDDTNLPIGAKPATPSVVRSLQGKVLYDVPGLKKYGQQTVAPKNTYRGQTVSAEFVGAHPNNDIQHNSSYLVIERWNGSRWEYVTSDNDPETTFNWKRRLAAQSRVTITWNIPTNARTGKYRIIYNGDSKNALGKISAFTGTSSEFQVL